MTQELEKKLQMQYYINVANDDTVSVSIEEILALRVPTQNQWLPTLCPGQ